MNCFSCFTSQKSKKTLDGEDVESAPPENASKTPNGVEGNQEPKTIKAQTFTFRELAVATKNFRQECLMGEGGFGRVYKGTISASGKVVAVKQLDRTGMNGSKDFLSEVAVLSQLNHENLVNLVGYCADGDQRLLVYEYMSGGSVDSRLFELDKGKPPMDWFARMKIALGAAKGLEYLHDTSNPPVVYRDLKSSNILLDGDGNPRLSDFGLTKLSGGDKSNLITPGVTGTYGYSAPEYPRTGHLTLKTDVYGFGVVLLELISGRRAIDTTRPNEEQNLISWAQPMFRNPKRFPEMADPLLKNNFPEKDLNQAVAVAAMCLQEEEGARPLMSDVVMTLSFLSTVPPEVIPASQSPATMPPAAESVSSEDGSEEEEEEVSDDGSFTESEDEGQEESDSGGGSKEFYAKSRGKSSKKESKKHDKESSSEEGSCSGSGSQKKSRKWRVLSHKSSKKGGNKEKKQKSSKKSSIKILSQKSSKKNSEKEPSQKSSKKRSEKEVSEKSGKKRIASRKASRGSRSEDETSRTTSQGDVSIGMRSSGELSDHRKEPKHHLPHASTTKHPPKAKDHKKDLLGATSAKM